MRIGLSMGVGAGGGAAPWTPRALGADLLLWLRADLGITLNGATVSAWADQSGAGRNATQGTAANQPTYQASNANFGGKPAVFFDASGTADFMSHTTAMLTGDASHSIFAVLRPRTLTSTRGYLCVGSTSVGTRATSSIGYIASTGDRWWWAGDDALTPVSSAAGTIVTNTPYVVGKTYDTATNTIVGYVNGATDVTSAGYAGFSMSAGYALGTYEGSVGGAGDVEIAEVLMMSTVATAAQNASIKSYLASRYGITVS